MKCPSCQKDVPEDMNLCGYCGASLSTPSKETSKESEIWKGAYCVRAMAHEWLLLLLWAGGLVAVRVALLGEEALYNWILLAAAGLPFLWILGRLTYRKLAIRYRLTTQRFFRTSGILLVSRDELELVRVDDLEVLQNLFQRILNVGNLVLLSPTDVTHPKLVVAGISDPVRVKEHVRECVRKLREKSVRFEQI